ncbi:MAG TPA: GGDEF domain-containing protein [Nocardioides sp.]|nr:GGDEF domain-containing protein [Nocardioides sp.]HRI98682.1 GGDEF domain-containing protein [Nocardioides sp.]
MQQLLTWMQPRDYRVAKRIVSAFATLGVAVTVVFLPLQDQQVRSDNTLLAIAGLALAVLVGMVVAARSVDQATAPAWALCPFVAIAAIVVIDLATHDASITAQIFFVFPVLYAGSQLPRRGAALVTSAAILGVTIVVAAHLPLRDVVTDAGYMAAALIATTVMLVRSEEARAITMAKLAHRAATDSLTGLVTRRAFEKATAIALTSARSEAGTALILVDLDKFKDVNDRYGHQAGDEVLVQVSALLVQSARQGDVVSRLGGDELALLMPDCSPEGAERRAHQIVDTVRTHGITVGAGHVIRVTASLGLAHAPTHAADLPDLYAAADAALYVAKNAGRNRLAAAPIPVG